MATGLNIPARVIAAESDPDGAAERRRRKRAGKPSWIRMLLRDKAAAAAALFLAFILVVAAVGPVLMGDLAREQNLQAINLPPFEVGQGWEFILGSDSLGRSLLARIVVASQTTLLIAIPAVVVSLTIGSVWGMWAGYHRGLRETVSMRIADVILSFPQLLLAVVVLYVLSPSALNIVLVLSITRIPIYLRTARSEAAELQSRLFVDAARTFGTRHWSIIRRHVAPTVRPTLFTVATMDFAVVMLSESSLSFLGIGIQPPDMSWGLMVAQGRDVLNTAWWVSVFPGLAIVLTTISATTLSGWLRLATDPGQRWRLTLPRSQRKKKLSSKAAAATATETATTVAAASRQADAEVSREDTDGSALDDLAGESTKPSDAGAPDTQQNPDKQV